jgi:hypothetical protein
LNHNYYYGKKDYDMTYEKNISKKMLNDFVFLLTFYGNDFTQKIQYISLQTYISLLIIYVKSFMLYDSEKYLLNN